MQGEALVICDKGKSVNPLLLHQQLEAAYHNCHLKPSPPCDRVSYHHQSRVFGDHFYFSSYFLSSAPIKLSERKPFPASEKLLERDLEACRPGGVWGGTVFQGVRTWWSHEKGLRRGHKSHEKVLQTYLTTISKTSPHSWQQDSNLDLDLVQIRKNVMQDLYHVMHQRWWRYQGVVGVCARGGAHVEAAYVATKIA